MVKKVETLLTAEQKQALKPFVRAAAALEKQGLLRSDAYMQPSANFSVHQWQDLLYAFEAFI